MQRSVCGSQARNRHAKWRTTDIIQSGIVEEFDRTRVAAMFATDAHLQIWACGAATFDPQLYELTNALDIQRLEWVGTQSPSHHDPVHSPSHE